MLPAELVPVAFSLIERFDKNTSDIMLTAGLNKKLGTHGLNISEINAVAAQKGMNFSEAMAIVEEDGWKYDIFWHDGESYVCSSFVAAIWKAAGMFGDTPQNAAEWSPKDLY
jgi:hypothetical protein